jgi:hypothetical protein
MVNKQLMRARRFPPPLKLAGPARCGPMSGGPVSKIEHASLTRQVFPDVIKSLSRFNFIFIVHLRRVDLYLGPVYP